MPYFLLAVFVIILLLYIMPISISIDTSRDNEDDKITIGLKTLYGLLKLKTEIPFFIITFENGKPALKFKVEVANKKRNKLLTSFTKLFTLEKGESLYRAYKNNKNKITPLISYMAKKIKIIDLKLKLGIGTGDAAATGVLYGIIWIGIGSIMTITKSYLNINKSRIIVVPIFNQVQFNADFNCIISMKSGHIINAGIRAIPALLSGIRK